MSLATPPPSYSLASFSLHPPPPARTQKSKSFYLLSTVPNTNEYFLQTANEDIGHIPGTHCKIKLFSDLLKDGRVQLAGHILRSNNSHRLGRVSYERNSRVSKKVGKRRMPGPRQQWVLYTSRYAWEKIEGETFENTMEQNQKLLELEGGRQF